MGKVDRPLHSLPAVAGAMLLGSAGIISHALATGRVRPLADKGLRVPPYPTAAMTLSSIAIGVGSAVTSIVVRVGLGLPAPAKCSA